MFFKYNFCLSIYYYYFVINLLNVDVIKTLDLLCPRWCLEPKLLYCFYISEYKPADLSGMYDETHANHGDLSDFVVC